MQYSSSHALGQSGFGSLNIQPSAFTELLNEQVMDSGFLEGTWNRGGTLVELRTNPIYPECLRPPGMNCV